MREPITFVEIEQDFCNLTYGVAPCMAGIGVTGNTQCYNTLRTCQDADNYDRGTKKLLFSDAQPPAGMYAVPSIRRIDTAPTVINPGGGGRRSGPLGQRASLSVTFQDHPSSDLLTDPYLDERGVDALRQGTFWTKWLARNPYYNNRIVRVYDGYVGDDLSEMTSRTYLIDKIEGPNRRGEVTLRAKDVLRLADNDKALAPAPSPGALRVDYGKDATGNIEVVGATTADYPASGTIRINREVFRYTGRSMSGDTLRFTGVTRATDGTERHDHKAGDRVQLCLRYNEVRVEELAREWLQDYADVPSEYIPFAEWQAEADLWLDQFDFTGLITEPTGVTQLLGEICEQALFYIWWDERAQLIRMQAIAPRIYEDVEQIDDRRNIIADSIDLRDEPSGRVSQVWVFWGVRDASASLNQDDNYTRLRVRADLDAESPEQYDDSRIRKIYSRWIHTEGQAINLSTRILNKLRDNPRTMTLELDAKDRRFWTGDVIDVLTRNSVNFLGEPQADRWQILSAEEIEAGHRVKYVLDLYEFGVSGLHGRWMEVSAPNYEDATPSERLAGAWWADVSGRIPDGDESAEGYMWI